MKEMTTEQKAEAYDKAKIRMKEFLEEWENCGAVGEALEKAQNVFPELKEESEDEKIRKEIINVFKSLGELKIPADINFADIFTWLEKQKPVEEIVERCKTSWYNEGKIDGMAEGLTDDEKYQQGWHDALEKQGEQKQDPCEHCKDKCLNCHNFPCIDKRTFDLSKTALEVIKEVRADNANKVEPKFKVGDWICNGGGNPCKVNYIFGNCYELRSIEDYKYNKPISDIDTNYHLWTIQDAKDGDVLVNGDEIVIFKKNSFNEKDLSGCMFVHCSLRNKRGYWYTIGGINPSNYVPATKEQRDLLFQKMHEADYDWDAEKKELKKINSYCQEHCKGYQETGKCYADGECEAKKNAETGWSEEDKKMSRCIGNAITADDASTYLESKDIQVIDAHVWLDELKDRVQPKQDWSEDDKRIFGEIILRCEKYGNQEQIDWLKSLKERYTWSPSDEQMEAVKSAALDIAKFSSRSEQLRLENEPYYKALVSLYRDLQKLREE